MSKRFKLILTIRFTGYLLFLIGLFGLFFMIGPVVQAEAKYRMDRILGVKRTVPTLTSEESKPTSEVSNGSGPARFDNVKASDNSIIPLSTEYGIVIEKINANAAVVPNVNPANEKEYVKALTGGVAEALGSTPPGRPGNLYLFSHSVDAPWNIVRFNAVFYLLKELGPNDKIIIFYKNKRYDYVVFDKVIVDPQDVSYLTNKYDSPILTLQTCDPPGTLLNRLIIRAKLVSNL